MGFLLHDINFWNWRAIVEIIRRLAIFDDVVVDGLHEQFMDTGLTQAQARQVAAALREHILPALGNDMRIKLDGTQTTEPDDLVFHRPGSPTFNENYSTTREVLEEVIAYLEACDGFVLS